MKTSLRRPLLLALAATVLATNAHAASRPQTTPLAEAELFISPSGEPFRSKPGEPYPVVQWFAQADANHDGKLDREEFRADTEAFFKTLDVHKTGVIGDDVINFYEKRIVPEILSGLQGSALHGGAAGEARLIKVQTTGQGQSLQIDPGGSPDLPPRPPREGEGPPKGAAAFGLLDDAEPIRTADRSFVGRIRLQDFLDQADRNFDALDYLKRGYLTLETLPRTPTQETARVARR